MPEVHLDTVVADSRGAALGIGADIAEQLADVLHRAHARGFVIEVHLVPLRPLAMGNFEMVGSVRPARERS